MLDVGNGGFSHFHETAGSHSQATRWKCQKPGKLPFSDVQLYFYEGEYCEHLRRFLRRQRTNGQPASAEVLLSRSIRVYSNWFSRSVKAAPLVNQEAHQRCDGIPRVAPPGS
jgi:hypothetical protein